MATVLTVANLEEKTLEELKELAKEFNLKIKSSMKKSEIIELIKECE